jgi:transposase-like protein
MTISYARHQFPPAIIRHAVWLYVRFTLSYRDVEDLLAERGLDVSYETVRRWVLKFGPLFARELRRRRPRPTSRWHLDEMAVMIAGTQFWLWRAVDDEGEVLDLLLQRRRDKAAAVKLMRNLLKKQGFAPDVLVTDKLRSYAAAKVRNGIVGAPRTRLAQEQSGREFASTDTTARAQDAALQVAWIGPAIPVRSRRRSQHIQRPASSRIPPHAPRPQRRSVPYVASCDRGLSSNRGF